MPRLSPRCLSIALLLSLLGTAFAEEPVLRLCADQWMPYNGDPSGP